MDEKKTGLDLTEFTSEEGAIKWNKGELIVPGDAPMGVMSRCARFRGIDSDAISEKHLTDMSEIISEILKSRNDEKDVDEFMGGLSFKQFGKVSEYVFKFVTGASEDEKQVKKKSD